MTNISEGSSERDGFFAATSSESGVAPLMVKADLEHPQRDLDTGGETDSAAKRQECDHDTIRRLRDAADMSEKGLPFHDDAELAAEVEEDIALWRKAADELAALLTELARANEQATGMIQEWKKAAEERERYRAALETIKRTTKSGGAEAIAREALNRG